MAHFAFHRLSSFEISEVHLPVSVFNFCPTHLLYISVMQEQMTLVL